MTVRAMAKTAIAKSKPKVRIQYKKVAPGMYQAEYTCPPHVWYYANTIMHWKCSMCPALRHTEPKTGLRTDDIIREYDNKEETERAR